MHLADHLDRIGKPWDGGGDEADRHGPPETLGEAPGGLEALPYGARVVGSGRGEQHGVAVGEADR